MTIGAVAPELDAAFVRALLRDDDQPRCSDLESGKSGQYTNDDGAGCDGAGRKAGVGASETSPGTAAGDEQLGMAIHPPAEIRAKVNRALASFETVEQYDAKIETAFAVNPATGEVALKKVGTEREVRFTPDEARELAGTVFTHNHPATGGGFSAPDIAMFLAHEMVEMRAFGRGYDGKLYHYRVTRHGRPATQAWQEWVARGMEMSSELHSVWFPEVMSGKRTKEDAELNHNHKVWEDFFADKPGFEYERRVVGEGEKRALRRAAEEESRDLAPGEQSDGGWILDGPGSEPDYGAPARGRRSDQPRCSEIEEGKPGKFTNEAGDGCEGAEGKKDAGAKADAPPATRFRTNVTPREFIDARNATTRPGFLSPLAEAELDGKTLVLSTDGKVGYMLAPDGYAGNLFNNGGPKGAGKAALVDAIERGASHLDCFDGFLPDLYHDYGFVETGRLKFVDEYAPTGWDFDRYGRPDVVFMAYRGGDRKTIKDRVGTFGEHRKPAELVDDYDEALDRAREVSRSADGAERRGVGREAQGAARRAGRVHRRPLARGDDDQPRCSELEEGKPGKYTNEAGDGCDGPSSGVSGGKVSGRGTLSGAAGSALAAGEAEERKATLRKLGITEDDILDMLVPAGAHATVTTYLGDHLWAPEATLKIEGDGFRSSRRIIGADVEGSKYNRGDPLRIINASLLVDEKQQGKGIGTDLLAREVEFAEKLGITRIETLGSRGRSAWGYYVWPALGFDGQVPFDKVPDAPKALRSRLTAAAERDPAPGAAPGVVHFRHLMADPEGRAWWKEWGDTTEFAFDTRKGSYSRDVLDRYLKARKARAEKRARIAAWLRSDDQPRCSDIIEGAPGKYTNEAGDGCDGVSSGGEFDGAHGGKGKVSIRTSSPHTAETMKELGLSTDDLDDLFGGEGREVFAYALKSQQIPRLFVTVKGEGLEADRLIERRADGVPVIYNNALMIDDRHKGTGTATLAREVRAAVRLGFRKIGTHAIGKFHSGDNGYYTWPRLGFDGRFDDQTYLPDEIKAHAREQGWERLSDAMRTQEGRDWWRRNGRSVEVEFDLTPGSLSRRVLSGYLRERAKRKAKRARIEAWLRDQPRCQDVGHEGEKGATQFSNEAGDGCDGAAGGGKKDPVKDYAVKGKGKIAFIDEMGGTAEAADAMLKQFGITPDDIVDLFGPEGSEVTYGIDVATKDPEGRGGALWIKTTLDDGERKMEAWRRIDKPSRKDLVLTNLDFHVEPRGSGFGTRFIAREVAAAERLGIKRIVIDTAAGGPNSTAYNGYYTWPLLGFDVPVKRLHTQLAFAELRERWPDAEYLSDIMKTPEGRKFWKEKGAGIFGMEFDVTPGSRSRRVLDAYLERKFGSDTKRAKVEAWLRSDQPRCSELEEGEPGRFTNEDGQGCEGAEGGGDTPMGGRKSKREPGDDSTTEYEAHKQGWRETTLADGTVVKTFIPDVDKLEPVEGEGKYTDRVQVDDAAARALKAERERLLAGDSDEQRAAAEKLAAEEQKLRELQEQFDEHQKRDMELYNELDDELRPAWQADQALADAIDTKLADGQEITPEEKAFRAAFEKDSLYSRIRAHERMAPLVEERSQWYNTLSDQRDAIRAAKQELVAADRQSLFLPEDERFDLVVSVADPAATAAGFRDPAAAMLWNDRLAEAKGFLSGVIHKDALTRTSDDATKPVAVSLKPENDFIPYRAYAFPGARNEVVLSADTNAAVMVHELGHLVESGLGSTSRFAPAVMEFLNSRLSDAERDAPFSKLISYHPDSAGYGMGVFRDHLDNLGMVVGGAPSDGWYAGSTHGMHLVDVAAGKLYPPKNFREIYETQKKSYFSVSNNTEVVSMGFEALFRNPRQFAKLDPDYFDFILGLARGYTKSAGRWGQPRKPSRKKRKPKK